jgi:aspartate beta-hydroxylase
MSAYDLLVGAVRRLYDHRIATPAVLDAASCFPEAERFRGCWRGIRDEALAVARDLLAVPRFHELLPDQAGISANDDRDWRMFVLKVYGVPLARNLERCPLLAGLLARTPDVLSAAFSFLAPGKHIPEHHGPFRGVLRFHLGLSVPPDGDGRVGTVMRVDGVDHRIGEGDQLLWDDTYRHEVWNRAREVRVALLLDVRRRSMPRELRLLSRALIGGVGLAMRWRLATGRSSGLG